MGASQLHDEKNDWKALVDKVCRRFSLITGNVLAQRQRPMVEARLRRYLTQKQISVADYPRYWDKNETAENEALIALLTTHFTAFFREFLHFEWLAQYLPQLVAQIRSEGRSELKVWSAACSRGQEVWSLAMWLDYHMKLVAPDFKWSVHGSDIDSESLKVAMNGVYHQRELQTAPRHLWQHLWQQGSAEIREWYRAKRELRSRCSFSTDNLLSLKESGKYDVIFCRNVLIYFNQANQIKTVRSLIEHLHPSGVLVTGVSESLSGLGIDFINLAPSVYTQKKSLELRPAEISDVYTLPRPIRVVCVDDSSTVLTILKKMLVSPDFEVVGVATNGEEALKQVELLEPDALTLDLHMPLMDGFTLVKTTSIAKKLPIVVVSTVERQNAPLVHPLFDAGVCDFLEKPTLENLSEVALELQQKIKMAILSKHRGLQMRAPGINERVVHRPSARVVLAAGLADRDSIEAFLKSARWEQDQICIHLNGESFLWESWAQRIKTDFPDYVIHLSRQAEWVRDARPTIVLAYAGAELKTLQYAATQNVMIILEDTIFSAEAKKLAHDCFPATSFAYMAQKLMEGK
jgi:chemotaxis protein methyltransferase CheR